MAMRVALKMKDRDAVMRLLTPYTDAALAEARRKKGRKASQRPKKKFQYGVYGGWFYPGYHNNSGADSSSSDSGAEGGGGESIHENTENPQDIIERFSKSCCQYLGLKNAPRIRLRRDPEWTRRNGTFGRYIAEPHNTIELATAGRHIIDILRTLAHEMTHAAQNERVGLPDHAGETGSEFEDGANAMAGRIMRHWAEQEPELFQGMDLDENWRRTAGAAAAAACIAGTPGCATTKGVSGMDALRTIQTVGRAAQNLPTRAGAEEELRQELKNIINKGRGTHVEPRIKETVATPVKKNKDAHQDYYNFLKAKRIAGRPLSRQEQQFLISFAALKNIRSKEVAESSGYIPTAAEKNDPRFSMALTVDVRPGETGRQANKLGLKTDSEGRPALLMKRLENLLESVKTDEDCWSGYQQQGMKKKGNRQVPNCVPVAEDEELMEVEMSPSAFKKFLNSPEAEGIRAGFEAELIFRNAQHDSDSGESEPDWDMDERTGSIQDIIAFFQGGENGMTGRQADRLNQELTEQFMDWAREEFANNYFDQDRFMSWAEENVWPDDADSYREDARANLDDEDATDEDVEKEAVTLFRDDVERDWDRSGAWYEMASEELFDEFMGDLDESDWLDSAGLRYMSDVSNEYSLDWPYWTEGSGGGGERDWQEIGNSLARATSRDVKVSSGYHNTRRGDYYVIEPDSSLDSDDSEDFGLEVVSPPMPLPEAIEQLNKVIDWANGDGDAYTNSSTGLHMGVSLPFKGEDVDPIKLILFMGDKNILETFGRESNTYARSAYDKLQSKLKSLRYSNSENFENALSLMKGNLIELAERELKRGVLGEKYVSVNPHDGYIEFRGPGGDYLSKESEIDGVLENTMLRLAYAMSIAGRPDLYRREYAKKLYKVLTGYKGAEISKGAQDTRYKTRIETEGENPFMRLFADYSAGVISGDELKRQWADTVLDAERQKDMEDVPLYTTTGEYEVYDRSTGTRGDRDSFTVIDTFRADSDEQALEIAQQKWSGKGISFGVRVKVVEPEGKKSSSRRAELAKRVTRSTRDVGEQLWRVNHHSSVRYVTARSQAEAVKKAVKMDRAFNDVETRARIATDQEKMQYQQDQERERLRNVASGAVETLRNTSRDPNANWAIARKHNDEIVIPFTRNTQQEAEKYFRDWIQDRVGGPDQYKLVQLASSAQLGQQQALARELEQMADLHNRAMDDAQGEWTGHWIVRDASGRELTRFHGIGNNQSDANRYAMNWLRQNPGHMQTGVEVVPEMQ
jgi:hypothetical protein